MDFLHSTPMQVFHWACLLSMFGMALASAPAPGLLPALAEMINMYGHGFAGLAEGATAAFNASSTAATTTAATHSMAGHGVAAAAATPAPLPTPVLDEAFCGF